MSWFVINYGLFIIYIANNKDFPKLCYMPENVMLTLTTRYKDDVLTIPCRNTKPREITMAIGPRHKIRTKARSLLWGKHVQCVRITIKYKVVVPFK